MTPKYCDDGLTGREAPTSGSPMKKMFDAHAKEHPAHISGTNSTGQHISKNPEKGKLGNRHKLS
jgi:hypothetical protein